MPTILPDDAFFCNCLEGAWRGISPALLRRLNAILLLVWVFSNANRAAAYLLTDMPCDVPSHLRRTALPLLAPT